MKRFVVAGFFFVLGLIILGVAATNLMNPDEPEPRQRPAAATETPRGHGPNLQQQQSQQPRQQGAAPYMTQAKPAQPAATPVLPGMPAPLSTTVPPAAIKQAPVDNTPHVPVMPQTDESTSRGK